MLKEKTDKALAVFRLVKYLRENPEAREVLEEVLRDPLGPSSLGTLKRYLRRRGLPEFHVTAMHVLAPGWQFKTALAVALEAAKMYEEGEKHDKVEELLQQDPKVSGARLALSKEYEEAAGHLARLYDRAVERMMRRRRGSSVERV